MSFLEVFWQDQVEKLNVFRLEFRRLTTDFYRSCVDVVADIDPFLERELNLVTECFGVSGSSSLPLPPGVFLGSGSKM